MKRTADTMKCSMSAEENSRLKVLKTYKIFIGGQFPRTESGRYYKLNTSQGEILNICLSSRKDFRNAVVAARAAQEKWAQKPAMNRSQVLYRIAEMMEGRIEQFETVLIYTGYTKQEAQKEVEESIDRLIYYAGWCDKYNQVFSSVNPVSSSHFNFSNTEAVGVVSVISSEKSALLGLVSVMASIIASGNTSVILASKSKPLAAITLAEVLATSDLPPGVVNILTGDRNELLTHFASHMDVNATYIAYLDLSEYKLAENEGAINVKRIKAEPEVDWYASEQKSPYRILDFLEIKTTWHPIGI